MKINVATDTPLQWSNSTQPSFKTHSARILKNLLNLIPVKTTLKFHLFFVSAEVIGVDMTCCGPYCVHKTLTDVMAKYFYEKNLYILTEEHLFH